MNLKELIEKGIVPVGTKIFMTKKGNTINAEILKDGHIKTTDGKIYKSPSGAARAHNEGKPIDGWIAWKLVNDKKLNLDSFRK
jgi:hypothetical protein